MSIQSVELENLIQRLMPDAAEQAERKALFGLGEQDVALIRELGQKLAGKEAGIVDALYAYLSKFDDNREMLGNPVMAERLKQHQRQYFAELLSGEFDEQYMLGRVRAGGVHQSHQLRLRWFFGSFAFYLDRLLPEVQRVAGDDARKLSEYYAVLTRLALFDIAQTVSVFVHADREKLRLFSTVFETNHEAVVIADLMGVVQHGNKSVLDVLGYTQQEIVGLDLHALPVPKEQALADSIWSTVKEGGRWQGEIRLTRKGGEEFTSWMSAIGVNDHKGVMTHIVAEFSDITAFKQTQDALIRRTEELANSNRELEQFAYVASHDLQEPLRMVASYTQLLARRYKDKLDDDANEFIHYAVDGATRMQALINDLLALSRIGTHAKPLGPCESEVALSRALTNLRLAIQESGATVTQDAMPTVIADISQLTQLFQNLIGNALKFHGDTPLNIHIGVERRLRDWEFSVRDNGIGIAPEHFERIFVIFQRLHGKQEYPGTGIGLAVCKKIVERHAGEIRVESKLGEGTVFYFTIPARTSIDAG